MYEIRSLCPGQRSGHRCPVAGPDQTSQPNRKFIVASSMSIYGEGAYDCENCGPVYPQLRGENQLMQRRWELECSPCQGELELAPALTKRTSLCFRLRLCDYQAGSGTVLSGVWTRLWNPHGRFALLQCLWTETGAFESLHRRLCHLLVAAVE